MVSDYSVFMRVPSLMVWHFTLASVSNHEDAVFNVGILLLLVSLVAVWNAQCKILPITFLIHAHLDVIKVSKV